jgi:hypothetical protein
MSRIRARLLVASFATTFEVTSQSRGENSSSLVSVDGSGVAQFVPVASGNSTCAERIQRRFLRYVR